MKSLCAVGGFSSCSEGRVFSHGEAAPSTTSLAAAQKPQALRELDLQPAVTPVVLVNSDEEIGSRESSSYIRMLARRADRAFVMEPTPRNRRLWVLAREAGALLDLELGEGLSGGVSDGNTTSQYAATLDGLGAVGDGAHAEHEFVYLDQMPERAALLALLVLADPVGDHDAEPDAAIHTQPSEEEL